METLSFKRPLPQILPSSVRLNACVRKGLWLILQQLVISTESHLGLNTAGLINANLALTH